MAAPVVLLAVARSRTVHGVVGALVLAPVVLLVLVALVSGLAAQAAQPPMASSGALRDGAVPAAYATLLAQASATCPGLSAPLLAAQLQIESGWDARAVSPAGAKGLAQFTAATWAGRGVDGDDDGIRDPFDPADAIASQAAFMCALLRLVGGDSRLTGDPVGLALAAYNAGPGAVQRYGGIPPYAETRLYVQRVLALAADLTDPAGGGPAAAPSAQVAAVLAYARAQLGKPYLWGGSGPAAYDCSGLTSQAYAAAGITLPRTSETQWRAGAAVPAGAEQPGDLVFFNPAGNGLPGHVGIYLGGGLMLDAPHTGAYVRTEAVAGFGTFLGTRRMTATGAA